MAKAIKTPLEFDTNTTARQAAIIAAALRAIADDLDTLRERLTALDRDQPTARDTNDHQQAARN